MLRRSLASMLVLGLLAPESIAFADPPTKAQCIAANESAQDLRAAGKFRQARAQLTVCIAESCPGPIREDCASRLGELERVQPTLVFDAKDGGGHDLVDVKVTIDGQPFTSRLDGHALPVDPGEHTFTFEAPGQPQVTEKLVVKEGQKERRERIVILEGGAAALAPAPAAVAAPPASAAAEASPPATAPTTPEAPLAESNSESAGGTRRTVALVIGGAGVVGVGLGVIFGLSASSKWSSAQDECGSPAKCPNYAQAISDHDSASSAATISTFGLLGGLALIGGGAALYLTAPPKPSASSAFLSLEPSLSGGNAGLVLKGRL